MGPTVLFWWAAVARWLPSWGLLEGRGQGMGAAVAAAASGGSSIGLRGYVLVPSSNVQASAGCFVGPAGKGCGLVTEQGQCWSSVRYWYPARTGTNVQSGNHEITSVRWDTVRTCALHAYKVRHFAYGIDMLPVSCI